VPKLAVRNRVSDESNGVEQISAANPDTGSENEHSAPASSNSSEMARTPMSNCSLSNESVNQSRYSASQRQIGDLSRAANDSGQSAGKKKRGGMLNFLTVKEPSTSAWAEFAKAEQEKSKQKGGSVIGSGAHKPSSQRLPNFVPKVNSKWDGLPDNVQKKSMDSKTSSRHNRNSITSNATRDTTWTTNSTVSGDSKMEKQAVATLSSRRVKDSLQSAAGRPSSSRGSGRQLPALALEEAVENTDENLPQTFLRGPSPPPQIQYIPDPTAPLSPSELEGDEMVYLQELAASAPNSPTTPPAEGSEARPALVGIHYPELDSIQKEAELFDDRNKEAVIRANSSRRPVNFSRPQLNKRASPTLAIQTVSRHERSASPLSQSDNVVLSPTLKNPSGKIEPFLTDTFALHSRQTGHIPQRVASTLYKGTERAEREPDEAPVSPISPLEPELQPTGIPDLTMRPPTAMSIDTAVQRADRSNLESESQLSLVNSIAPSEMSEQWRMSPRERLGLGSKIRKREKGDVLPWEMEDDPADDAGGINRDRLSPSPGPESRMKRLSRRLSTKK
jgi:hypothetical protein